MYILQGQVPAVCGLPNFSQVARARLSSLRRDYQITGEFVCMLPRQITTGKVVA